MDEKYDRYKSKSDAVNRMARSQSGHLNTWATVFYFRAAGGEGYPSWDDCHGIDRQLGAVIADPPILTPEEVKILKITGTVKICDDSRKRYDASYRKYEQARRVKIEFAVLDSILIVERALAKVKAPPVLRAYLLFCYPQWGQYVPIRSDSWRDDPLKAFLLTKAAREHLLGCASGHYVDRNARGLVANLYANLLKEIK